MYRSFEDGPIIEARPLPFFPGLLLLSRDGHFGALKDDNGYHLPGFIPAGSVDAIFAEANRQLPGNKFHPDSCQYVFHRGKTENGDRGVIACGYTAVLRKPSAGLRLLPVDEFWNVPWVPSHAPYLGRAGYILDTRN